MTETDTPQSAAPRRRPRRWLVPAIAALVLLVAAGTGWYAFRALGEKEQAPAKSAKTMDVVGNITLTDGVLNVDGVQCAGRGGYDDIRPGAQVVVTDAAGSTIALGELRGGHFEGTSCVLEFTVRGVPTGQAFYGVEVSHRGRLQYTEIQVREFLRLSLGR